MLYDLLTVTIRTSLLSVEEALLQDFSESLSPRRCMLGSLFLDSIPASELVESLPQYKSDFVHSLVMETENRNNKAICILIEVMG